MKYVIFKHKAGCFMPVIFAQHITHSMIKIEDCIADSAGFFALEGGVKILDEGSESLNLKPNKERDLLLIASTLMNAGTYAFLDF